MNDEDFAELFKQLSSGKSTSGSWQDVRVEFESLGKTLGDVLRSAWQSQDTETSLGRLRDLLASATNEWNDAVEGTPEAQQARDQFERVTDSLSSAVERAGEQVRPELLRLLREANTELRRRSGLDA
jgi:hypothetical protein